MDEEYLDVVDEMYGEPVDCELCGINKATEVTRCGIPACMDCKLAHQFEGCDECEHDEWLEHGDIQHDEEILRKYKLPRL